MTRKNSHFGSNCYNDLYVLLQFSVPPQLFLDKQFEEEVVLKAGQSMAFEIPFKGNPQPKVTWTYNDEPLPQEKRIESETIYNMTTLRLGKVKRSDTGNYTLTLENSAGKVSITIKLTVLGMCTLIWGIIFQHDCPL